jgi:Helix-turn-helix.
MNYNYKITGQVIGRIRVRHKMSQEVLSGLSGVARSHLAMIESGSKNANVDTLWRIAEALDMRLSNLMQLVEEEHARLARKP